LSQLFLFSVHLKAYFCCTVSGNLPVSSCCKRQSYASADKETNFTYRPVVAFEVTLGYLVPIHGGLTALHIMAPNSYRQMPLIYLLLTSDDIAITSANGLLHFLDTCATALPELLRNQSTDWCVHKLYVHFRNVDLAYT